MVEHDLTPAKLDLWLSFDVNRFVKLFEGGRIISSTEMDYIAPSGAKFPARKFTFEADGQSGKGLVIAFTRQNVLISGWRDKQSVDTAPIERFLSSFVPAK